MNNVAETRSSTVSMPYTLSMMLAINTFALLALDHLGPHAVITVPPGAISFFLRAMSPYDRAPSARPQRDIHDRGVFDQHRDDDVAAGTCGGERVGEPRAGLDEITSVHDLISSQGGKRRHRARWLAQIIHSWP